MKKILALFLIFCVIIVVIIYFNLPANNSFSKTIYLKTNQSAAERFLFDESNWIKWWPSDLKNNLAIINIKNDHNNYSYSLYKKMYGGINIVIKKNETEFRTTINLLSLGKDSLAVAWNCQLPTNVNPIFKIRNYFYAKNLKRNADEILENLKSFLENNDSVYSIHIKQIMVTDTLLIATRYASATYPSTPVIYGLIQNLKNYISINNATETNPPMLHIAYDSGYYKTMIAVPVNRELEDNGNFLLKKMVSGKILVTQIKGGLSTTSEAFRQLQIYVDDNHLSSPAIPFESLITNRMTESDTSKWITKIYYPIF
ncbi:MAG: GyrI-like domain-containing protein [Ginsengibacter sp.]